MGESEEFNTLTFEKKLMQLKDTQESIQGLSSWCLKQRAHHKKIVASWLNVLKRVKVEQRLVLFYLANDVIQYSKRKNYEFVESWGLNLQKATPLVREEKVRQKILRIFKIWEQRSVYDDEFLSDLTGLLSAGAVKKTDDEALDFQPQQLVNKIKQCSVLEADTDLRLKNIHESHLQLSDTDALCASLKENISDKTTKEDIEKELNEGIGCVERYTQALQREIVAREALLALLASANQYYSTQRGEVKVVAYAYKNFGARVRALKRKLDELIPTLPAAAPSPPQRDEDVPSPGPDEDLELPNATDAEDDVSYNIDKTFNTSLSADGSLYNMGLSSFLNTDNALSLFNETSPPITNTNSANKIEVINSRPNESQDFNINEFLKTLVPNENNANSDNNSVASGTMSQKSQDALPGLDLLTDGGNPPPPTSFYGSLPTIVLDDSEPYQPEAPTQWNNSSWSIAPTPVPPVSVSVAAAVLGAPPAPAAPPPPPPPPPRAFVEAPASPPHAPIIIPDSPVYTRVSVSRVLYCCVPPPPPPPPPRAFVEAPASPPHAPIIIPDSPVYTRVSVSRVLYCCVPPPPPPPPPRAFVEAPASPPHAPIIIPDSPVYTRVSVSRVLYCCVPPPPPPPPPRAFVEAPASPPHAPIIIPDSPVYTRVSVSRVLYCCVPPPPPPPPPRAFVEAPASPPHAPIIIPDSPVYTRVSVSRVLYCCVPPPPPPPPPRAFVEAPASPPHAPIIIPDSPVYTRVSVSRVLYCCVPPPPPPPPPRAFVEAPASPPHAPIIIPDSPVYTRVSVSRVLYCCVPPPPPPPPPRAFVEAPASPPHAPIIIPDSPVYTRVSVSRVLYCCVPPPPPPPPPRAFVEAPASPPHAPIIIPDSPVYTRVSVSRVLYCCVPPPPPPPPPRAFVEAPASPPHAPIIIPDSPVYTRTIPQVQELPSADVDHRGILPPPPPPPVLPILGHMEDVDHRLLPLPPPPMPVSIAPTRPVQQDVDHRNLISLTHQQPRPPAPRQVAPPVTLDQDYRVPPMVPPTDIVESVDMDLSEDEDQRTTFPNQSTGDRRTGFNNNKVLVGGDNGKTERPHLARVNSVDRADRTGVDRPGADRTPIRDPFDNMPPILDTFNRPFRKYSQEDSRDNDEYDAYEEDLRSRGLENPDMRNPSPPYEDFAEEWNERPNFPNNRFPRHWAPGQRAPGPRPPWPRRPTRWLGPRPQRFW